jgi:hypothetical protein
MATDKAAIFVDNSNVFKGMQAFSRYLVKRGDIARGQYLRMRWNKVLDMLESQDGGLDIYARHFFASLPPAADVSRLKRRPTEEEWEKMVKESAQSGFYKVIQNPPFNFTLHGIPLRFSELRCRRRMRSAYYKCLNAQSGEIKCGSSSECVLTFWEVKLAKSVDHGQGECLFAAITPGSVADGLGVVVHCFN